MRPRSPHSIDDLPDPRSASSKLRGLSCPRGIVSSVKAPYEDELAALPAVYAVARSVDVGDLKTVLCKLRGGPAVFVGAGGTMALAQLGARLHESCASQPAAPATTLQGLTLPQVAHRGAVLFSSSAKHPDARLTLAEFKRRRFNPAITITHRAASDIEPLAGPETIVM